MKGKKVFQVMGLAGMMLFLAAGTSMAVDREPGPEAMQGPGPEAMQGPGHPRGEERWKNEMKELGLSPEQSAKMKALREGNREAEKELRAQLRMKNAALRQELDAIKPDRAKAESIVKEISALEEKVGLARVDQALKVREILTPEQARKLREWHEKNKKKFRHFREQGWKQGKNTEMKAE